MASAPALNPVAMLRPMKLASTRWPALPVLFLLIGLVVPWSIELGSFGLTMSRIVLLFMTVPCLIKWARGDVGKATIVDWIVLALCGWTCISLAAIEGLGDGVESGGMIAVETAGAYFLARCYVRSADDFLAVVRTLFILVILLLPLALVEGLTGVNLAMSLFGAILPTVAVSNDGLRWGIKRVQSVYEHPILFGVCTGATLALVYMVLGEGLKAWQRILCALLVMATSFLSISSGAMGLMAFQIGLIGWAKLTARIPKNWLLLGGLIGLSFVVIELGTSQSVPQFYISRFSVDRETAWLRVLIWEFGLASVFAHPLFGIGFGSWVRPSWMTDSIDMFWMAAAVRHGMLGGLLTISLPVTTVALVAMARRLDARSARYRVAYLIVIASFFLVGWTVHFWGSAYILFLFLLGAGGWFVSGPRSAISRSDPVPVRFRGGAGVAHLARRGT